MNTVVALAIDISLNYGDFLLANNEKNKAIAVFNECLHISQQTGQSKLVTASLARLGGAYVMSRDFPKGISYYEQALEIVKDTNGHEPAMLALSKALADLYRRIGDFTKANFHSLNYSALLRKQGKEIEETERKAKTTHVYQSVEECWEAIAEGSKNLAKSKETHDKRMEADAYASLGFAYRMLRDFTQAISYLEKYLEMCKELDDTRGKGVAYGNLGPSYRALGEIKKAMECFELVLQVTKITGDKLMEGSGYTNLGICYMDVGDYQKAVQYFEQSLAIAITAGFRGGEGGAYCNLSNAYFKLADPNKALNYAEKYLKLAQEMGDRRAQAKAYSSLGNAHHAMGNLDTARTFFQRCADLGRETGDRTATIVAEGSLGLVCESLEGYKKSLIHHQASLRTARETGNKLHAAQAMSNKARCFFKLKNYTGAIVSYEQSIKELEDIRANLGTEDKLKVSIGDLHTVVYKALARTMLYVDQVQDALLVADRGRAMALKDLLYHKFEVKGEYRNMKEQSQEMNRLSKFVDKLRQDPNQTTLLYCFIDGTMYTWVVSNSQVNVVKWPEKEEDTFWSLTTLIETSLAEIRQGVWDHGMVEDRGMSTSEQNNLEDIFTIDDFQTEARGQLIAHKTKTEDPSLQAIRKGLSASTFSESTDISDPRCSLRELYKVLIKPVKHFIQGHKLLIIPETFLYRLPFSALVDDEGRFLCQKYSLQMCTSLETLAMISERPNRELVGGALVIGNPLVGRVNRRGIEIQPCQLPGAQKEAEKVASYLHTTALTGRMATKARVIHHFVEATVIHIAAHGDPDRGEIFLAPNPDPARGSRLPTDEEYMLSCADIAELRLRARLVVLSCCQSGRGEIRAEGVVGIARSFLGAGAKSVVVTLWAIDDDATLSFMEMFYNHLYQNKSISEALQQTMILMQANQEFKSISKWAPFYLIGDDVKFGDDEISNIRDKAFTF